MKKICHLQPVEVVVPANGLRHKRIVSVSVHRSGLVHVSHVALETLGDLATFEFSVTRRTDEIGPLFKDRGSEIQPTALGYLNFVLVCFDLRIYCVEITLTSAEVKWTSPKNVDFAPSGIAEDKLICWFEHQDLRPPNTGMTFLRVRDGLKMNTVYRNRQDLEKHAIKCVVFRKSNST